MNGSEAIVRTLKGLGVDVIFGLCGDTTLPLHEALYDIDHGMRARRVERPSELGASIEESLASDGPYLLDCRHAAASRNEGAGIEVDSVSPRLGP